MAAIRTKFNRLTILGAGLLGAGMLGAGTLAGALTLSAPPAWFAPISVIGKQLLGAGHDGPIVAEAPPAGFAGQQPILPTIGPDRVGVSNGDLGTVVASTLSSVDPGRLVVSNGDLGAVVAPTLSSFAPGRFLASNADRGTGVASKPTSVGADRFLALNEDRGAVVASTLSSVGAGDFLATKGDQDAVVAATPSPVDPDRFVVSNGDPGAVVRLAATAIGVNHNVGDEPISGVHVENAGDDFLMGSGNRNPDDLMRATVVSLGDSMVKVGLADLSGEVGRGNNGNAFLPVGGLATVAAPLIVPEPGSLGLLGLGLLGLALSRRRKHSP